MSATTITPGDLEVINLTRRLDHSVPDGDFAPETSVEFLTRRLDHSVPDGDFVPAGTEV
ncbi:hypothetical protein [Kitasatospora sp. NPDC097643]|uniref:hypothetical protein n=1 Tax=Kitasatospora sp. NPDC097643 TaxID=3157230 RepID=UPI00332C8063